MRLKLSSLAMRPDDRAGREGTPLTWDPRKERERGMAPDWWADLARWYWRNHLRSGSPPRCWGGRTSPSFTSRAFRPSPGRTIDLSDFLGRGCSADFFAQLGQAWEKGRMRLEKPTAAIVASTRAPGCMIAPRPVTIERLKPTLCRYSARRS